MVYTQILNELPQGANQKLDAIIFGKNNPANIGLIQKNVDNGFNSLDL